MPEVDITIGGRSFQVFCQEGEERNLHAAAKIMDDEATAVLAQIGRIPESRMLLMASLMLAYKTTGLQDDLLAMEAKLKEAQSALARLRSAPDPAPERIEVPVVPASVTDTLAEIAARAEALAETIDGKRAG